MGIAPRQIGWSTEANLLWQISKTLDDIIQISCCTPTTTTTTTAYITTTTTTTCIGCNSIMEVGSPIEGYYGYVYNSFGTLTPDCPDIYGLLWNDGILSIFIISDVCCPEVVVEINGQTYALAFDISNSNLEGVCPYILVDIANPFPGVGETCTISLCYPECTTTTTTEFPN